MNNILSEVLSSMNKSDILDNIILMENTRNEYSKILYNYKYGDRKEKFRLQYNSQWLDIIERYKSINHIEDDAINVEDILKDVNFRDFLIEKCTQFSKYSKRGFVWLLTDYNDGQIHLRNRIEIVGEIPVQSLILNQNYL